MKCPNCKKSNNVRSASSIVVEQTKMKKSGEITKTLLAEKLSDYRYVSKPGSLESDCGKILQNLVVVPLLCITLFLSIGGIAYQLQSPYGGRLEDLAPMFGPFFVCTIGLIVILYLRKRSKEIYERSKSAYNLDVERVNNWNERVSNANYCNRCDVRFDELGEF